MESSIEHMQASFAYSPLIDIAICIGVICAIGYFLWNKGRFTIAPKR